MMGEDVSPTAARVPEVGHAAGDAHAGPGVALGGEAPGPFGAEPPRVCENLRSRIGRDAEGLAHRNV